MKKKSNLLIIIAPILYVLAVIIGGALKENYSHIFNSISELSLVGTERIFVVELLFTIYNILIIFYSIYNLCVSWKKLKKLQIFTLLSILLCGIGGIIAIIFPQETRNSTLTFVGMMHFVAAGITAITSMSATLLSAFEYKYDEKAKKYSVYSLITFFIVLVFGALGPIMISTGIDTYFGVVERITIGAFMIWLFMTGLTKYRSR